METLEPEPNMIRIATLAATALGQDSTPARDITAADLEVAVLDRTRSQPRKFKRLTDAAVADALAG